jgi:hypothetical protein
MWTKINQVYASPHQMNAWAHLVGTNKWHKVKPIATDGVTNTFLILATAKGADRQVYVGIEAGTDLLTAVYM